MACTNPLSSLVTRATLLVAIGLGPIVMRATVPLEVVSKPYTNIAHVFGDSVSAVLSADGRWAAFGSSGNGLATNDSNGFTADVFLRDLQTGTTTLLTRNLAGASADGDSIVDGISADGRFVLIESDADDLTAEDENESTDVFLYDRENGTLKALTTSSEGESGSAIMTRNGQFVLFETTATEFSVMDTNGAPDLYLLNRTADSFTLVTVNSNNTAAATSPFPNPSIGLLEGAVSEDGRYVAFVSPGTDHVRPLIPANSDNQLYLRDIVAGTNRWISHTAAGAAGRLVTSPILSTNGAALAFLSTRLVTPSTVQWLHVYNVESNLLTEIPNPGGVQAGQPIDEFTFSANGRYLAYALAGQIYRYDIEGGTNLLLSAATNGSPANNTCSNPEISDDGKIVIFVSAAGNLAPGGTNDPFQLFRYDAGDSTLVRLTPSLEGSRGANHDILFPVLDGQGSKVAFTSYASDLTVEDDKFANDVFVVATSGTNVVQLVSSPSPDSISATAVGISDLPANALSEDGRFVVFTSIASDIVPADNNNSMDVFVRDLQTGTTRLVSNLDGTHPFPSSSSFVSMSRDGRYVAFSATNSTAPAARPILVGDLLTGSNVVASVLSDGSIVPSQEGFLSADGSLFAFRVASPPAIFVRDLVAQTTHAVTNALIQQSGQFSFSPSGRYVVVHTSSLNAGLIDRQTGSSVTLPGLNMARDQFSDNEDVLLFLGRSQQGNALDLYLYSLLENKTNVIATNVIEAGLSRDGSTILSWERTPPSSQLVIHDLKTGSATSIPQTTITQTNFGTGSWLKGTPRLSEDGRFIAFVTPIPILGGEGTGFNNVFLYDRVLTNLTLISQNAAGTYGNAGSTDPSLSADGRTIAFQSGASDFVENDRNQGSDVFVARIPITDSDSDQLEDGWEILHFGDLSKNGQQDSDGDGISNLQEFLAGTDPNAGGFTFEIRSSGINGSGKFVLETSAVAGKAYQFQFRADLGTGQWQNLGTPQTATTNTLPLQAEMSQGRNGFYRVQLVE